MQKFEGNTPESEEKRKRVFDQYIQSINKNQEILYPLLINLSKSLKEYIEISIKSKQ